ncbi:MAG: hypothetical protein JXX29_22805 [Deltaproteobacteria bacterium]|nr:hypothetical protein [Deltaproteobacteria bacterium]MBN2674529.1 hypothetical protein [Deltaproteobacteria bacterium]
MNDQLTQKILDEARASLDPTSADRSRVERRLMSAIGAATVITAAGAGAANTGGWLTSVFGISATAASVLKIAGSALLISGVITLTVVGTTSHQNDNTAIKNESASTSGGGGDHDAKKIIRADAPSNSVMPIESGHAPLNEDATNTPQLPTPAPIVKGDNAQLVSAPTKSSHTVHAAPRRVSAPMNSLTPSSPNDDALLMEIALLKNASQALQKQEYQRAVQLLRNYPIQFPTGTMRQERDGLYISALCGAGQLEAAQEADRQFRYRYRKPPMMFDIAPQCSASAKEQAE